MWRCGLILLVDRLSAYKLALRWFESGCHREKKVIPPKKSIYNCDKKRWYVDYMYNCVVFFPSGTSLRARTFVPNVGWGGHNSTVGLTLLEVWARAVQCVARGEPFKLFGPWAHLRQIPGFRNIPGDWVSASPIPAYVRKTSTQTELSCSEWVHVSFPLFAQSTTLILPPSSSLAP